MKNKDRSGLTASKLSSNAKREEKTQTEAIRVKVSKLNPKEHGSILCYPGTDMSSFASRLEQLKKLNVKELVLEGSSKVGKFGVVGKGCVSLVLKAEIKGVQDLAAIKIRRVDANRPTMEKDFELQKFANSFGVGPKAISASEDLFIMEHVDSIKLGKWFQNLKTRSSKKYLRKIIRDCLNQCYLLDIHKLDHGELSNPSKHILIRRNEPRTVIIDFESASTSRRVSNLTSVAQFFFLGGWQSNKVRKILNLPEEREEIVRLLRSYKEEPGPETFENFMKYVGC